MSGGGQSGSAEQTKVVEALVKTEPDIAELLDATSVYTDVPRVVAVMVPETTISVRLQVMVTALPEMEPLIRFSPTLAPGAGGT